MLDVYKQWRNNYDKKSNEHLLKHFKDSEIDEIIRKRLEEPDEDGAGSKKIKLSPENEVLTSIVICLPLKFIKYAF
jgi:hypothetical protein